MSEAGPPSPKASGTIVAIGDRRAPQGNNFEIGFLISMDNDFVTIEQVPILGGEIKRYMREEVVITELKTINPSNRAKNVVPFEPAAQHNFEAGLFEEETARGLHTLKEKKL